MAQTIGNFCEVILHDFTDMEHSIVAISKNRLTGREVGGTVTDFALGVVQNKKYQEQDFLVNYIGKGKSNGQVFRSGTLYIKDDEKNILGMLCVNVDITQLRNAKEVIESMMMLHSMIEVESSPPKKEENHEHFAPTAEVLLGDILYKACTELTAPPERLTLAEKRAFVATLSNSGCFLLKGGVLAAANVLGVSEQTIYRYIKELNI